MPRQWRRSAQIAVRYVAPVKAPVLRGTELGRLEMSGEGVPAMSIPLYAGMDVPMLGFLPRILGGVRTLVLGS